MVYSKILRYSTAFLCLLLLIGETIILLKTNKYWPLSLDDYLAASGLLLAAYLAKNDKFLPLLAIGWAFVLGNMYAMLFSRLDPIHGSGERIGLLIFVNIIALIFLLFSILVYHKICFNQKE